MAEHALKGERGAVVLEFMMLFPFILLVLVFVLDLEVGLRESWASQAAARIGVWTLQRTCTLPGAAFVGEQVRIIDARSGVIELVTLQSPSRSETGLALQEAISGLGTVVPGLSGFGRSIPDGVRATSDFSTHWGLFPHTCYLRADTWEAVQSGAGDGAFRSAGDGQAAGILQQFSSVGR